MSKSPNQKLKALYLLKYLLEETSDEDNSVTMEDILKHLEQNDIKAERKSVYDDINALKDFGYDINTSRQYHRVGYYIGQREFELPELKLLVDAVQSSKFLTKTKSRKLITKIEKLTSKSNASCLDRQVNVPGRIRNMDESIYYSVDDIHTALSDNKKITFRYFDRNVDKQKEYHREKRTYSVSPYLLIWDDENYYLVGRDDEKGKNLHFRVDKMDGICISKERRDMSGEAECKSSDYTDRCFGMFGGESKLVTFRCRNDLAGIIIDRFGSDTLFRKHEDGTHFMFSANVVEGPTFYSWVAMFEGGLSIVSPENIRQNYKDFIQKITESL